jgi:uncharacterized membrane protein YfcA
MAHFLDFGEALTAEGGWKLLVIAIAVSAASGFLRGFTGFGSALLYIPSMAALYDPQTAAATLVIIDLLSSVWQTVEERRKCQWRDVWFMTVAAPAGALAGTIALSYAEPIHIRYLASVVVLVILIALAVIAAGWRYRARPGRLLTATVGLFSGFLGGAVAMEGPPVVLFWLSGTNTTEVTRANVMMFIVLTELAVLLFYVAFELITIKVVILAIILLPFFWVAFWLGDRKFHGAAERTYRIVAGVVVALSAFGTLFVHSGAG